MKKLIGLLLLFATMNTIAQSYFGMDSVQINGRNALMKVPTGTGPWPLLIQVGSQTENLSSHPAGLSGLYTTGTPKIISGSGNPYFLKNNGDSLKYIFIKWQPANYNDGVFSDDIALFLSAIWTTYGSIIDTSKFTDGTYKYIGLAGEEKGADAFFNALTATSVSGGCFFHGNPGWQFAHIKKIYSAQISDVCSIGSLPSAAYINATTKKIRYFKKSTASTIEIDMKASLAANSPGVVQVLNEISGLTDQQLVDSMYSKAGLYAQTNIYRDLVEDTTLQPPPNYQAKIYDIFPLNPWAQHDPNSPWRFFDGYLVSDPKNGITADTTSVGNKQHGWDITGGSPSKVYGDYYPNGISGNMIYPGLRNCRAIIDMVGVRNLLDTTKKFKFTDIWGLNGEIGGLTINFYNADKILRQSIANRPGVLARPDSLLTPFASITTTGSNQWITSTATDSCRFVLMIITTDGTHSANFNELKFYGQYNYDPTATAYLDSIRPQTYAGSLPSKKNSTYTFDKTNGTNLFQGLGPNSTKYEGWLRLYTGKNYFDTANVRNVPTGYAFWPSPSHTLDATEDWMQSLKAAGKTIRITNQGSNMYTTNQGNNGWDIDSTGLEPELPTSYKRAGDFAYNFAAKFGSVAVSSGNTKWIGDAGYPNGLNVFSGTEFGNESEAHGGSYPAIFYKLSMEYDGHCNTIGTSGKTGVKNADAAFKLSTSGSVEPDTNMIKTFFLLSKWTRTDGQVPFDEIALHKYFSNKDSGYAITWGLETQVGMLGVPPEWVIGTNSINGGWLNYWNNVARNIYKYVPTSIPLYHNEVGNGNSGDTIHNTGEAAATFDIYPAMPFGPWNNLQAKGIINSRRQILSCFTPLAANNEFASMNQFGDPANTNRQLFYAYGKAASPNSFPTFEYTVFFAEWYMQSSYYARLTNYYPDSVLLNGGRTGRWQVRFRNVTHSDSVCHLTWLGSFNGSIATSQAINLGSLATTGVTEIKPSFTSLTDTTASLTASSNVVTRTVDERPTMYFAKEAAGNVSPVANAGPDQSFKLPRLTYLDGSGSTDSDGTIVSYSWTQISGGHVIIINSNSVKATLVGLVSGTYVFRLTVTDNQGATSTDDITITVGNRTYSSYILR